MTVCNFGARAKERVYIKCKVARKIYAIDCMRYGMQFWREGLVVCNSVCHSGAKAKERV